MKVYFDVTNYYANKNSWHCMMPSLGCGYCRGLMCISLYIFFWEFSINFDWEK